MVTNVVKHWSLPKRWGALCSDEQHSAGSDEEEHVGGTEVITIDGNIPGGKNNVEVQGVVTSTTEGSMMMRQGDETTVQHCLDNEYGGTIEPSRGDDEQHLVRERIVDIRGGTNTEGGSTVDDSCVERGGDGGTREGNIGEKQHGMVKNIDDVTMSTTPPVGDMMMNRAQDRGSARECIEMTICVISEERRCVTHDCGTRTINVTSSKWNGSRTRKLDYM